MALTNDAKIKDIITELQNMQMVNGKSEVVNALGSPFTATDNPTQIVDKIQALKNTMATNLNNKGIGAIGTETLNELINKIGNINISTLGGKKWATGTTYLRSFSISNLTFTPSLVIIYSISASSYNGGIVLLLNKKELAIAQTTVESYSYGMDSTVWQSNSFAVHTFESNLITNNGFTYSNDKFNNNKKWIAFE